MSTQVSLVTDVVTRLIVTNAFDSNTVITVRGATLIDGAWEPGYAPEPQSDIAWLATADWRARGPLPNGCSGSVSISVVVGTGVAVATLTFQASSLERLAAFNGNQAVEGAPWIGMWAGQKTTLDVSLATGQMTVSLTVGALQSKA